MPQRNVNVRKNGRKAAHHGKNGSARPIRSKHDYAQAADIVNRLTDQLERETTAELRLQALIHEMERYDNDMDDFDDDEDFSFEDEYDGPLRRWSDDPNDLD
jgi:hypothetical protein